MGCLSYEGFYYLLAAGAKRVRYKLAAITIPNLNSAEFPGHFEGLVNSKMPTRNSRSANLISA